LLAAIAVLACCTLQSPVHAQQRETGPATSGKGDGHPLKGPETGVRGPSGSSPDTGYHGPRDVTKDQEPGKPKTAKEKESSGSKKN
jgi:hypothetical protein